MFLLVEVPLAILIITMCLENTLYVELIDRQSRDTAQLVMNTITLFSYPFNFFIYCIMSRQFRDTFVGFCHFHAGRVRVDEADAARFIRPSHLAPEHNENGSKESKV